MRVSNRPATGLPRAWPLVGHFPAYGRDPLAFVMRMAAVGGGVAPVRLGPLPGLLLSDPAAIEEVLVTRQRDFRKSPATRRVGVVIGQGLLISEGETWRERRRVVQPAFHHQRVSAWGEVMAQEAESAVARWHDGQVIDIHAEMTALTLRIVVRTLLGGDVSEDEIGEVGRAADVLTDHFASRFNGLRYFVPDALPTPGNLRMRRAVRQLDQIVYRLIEAGRARAAGTAERRPDVISMLLEPTTDGVRLSDRQVRDETMTLFMAGHETTALALTWSLHLLAAHPEAAAEVEQEADSVLGGRSASVGDLPALRRTESVVLETLRLYPPAYAISREAVVPTMVAGRRVGRGHIAFISIYATHRDAANFPQPDEFRPQRWLDGLARRLPRGAYLPFAEGPRKCIGASFAMQEAVLLLATIIGRTRLRAVAGQPIGLRPAVTLRPDRPLLLTVQRRQPSPFAGAAGAATGPASASV